MKLHLKLLSLLFVIKSLLLGRRDLTLQLIEPIGKVHLNTVKLIIDTGKLSIKVLLSLPFYLQLCIQLCHPLLEISFQRSDTALFFLDLLFFLRYLLFLLLNLLIKFISLFLFLGLEMGHVLLKFLSVFFYLIYLMLL